jgi:hypothetical protein
VDVRFHSFLLPVGGVPFSVKILAQTGISWEGGGISPWLISIFGEHMGLLQSTLQVPLSMITLTAIRNQEDEVYSITDSC